MVYSQVIDNKRYFASIISASNFSITDYSGQISSLDTNMTTVQSQIQTINDTSLPAKEDKSNKVIALSDSSTDTQYPSAKATWDTIQSITGAIPEGLKVPIELSTESQLPVIAQDPSEIGNYYIIQNMTASAPGHTGKAWVNYSDPTDHDSQLKYYKIVDQYLEQDDTSIVLNGNSKLTVSSLWLSTQINTALLQYQPLLQSGTNIKTINDESILGSGNIDIGGGGGGGTVTILTLASNNGTYNPGNVNPQTWFNAAPYYFKNPDGTNPTSITLQFDYFTNSSTLGDFTIGNIMNNADIIIKGYPMSSIKVNNIYVYNSLNIEFGSDVIFTNNGSITAGYNSSITFIYNLTSNTNINIVAHNNSNINFNNNITSDGTINTTARYNSSIIFNGNITSNNGGGEFFAHSNSNIIFYSNVIFRSGNITSLNNSSISFNKKITINNSINFETTYNSSININCIKSYGIYIYNELNSNYNDSQIRLNDNSTQSLVNNITFIDDFYGDLYLGSSLENATINLNGKNVYGTIIDNRSSHELDTFERKQ
jgi:hypothetical protein